MPRAIQVEQAQAAVRQIQDSSIPVLTNEISADLDRAQRLISNLRTWMGTLDRKAYVKIEPWSTEIFAAYNAYKADVDAVTPARKKFKDYKKKVHKKETVEDCVRLAQLAIEWGRKAVR